jgi:hypothetical protein
LTGVEQEPMPRATFALMGLLVLALLVSCAQMEKARVLPSEAGKEAGAAKDPEEAPKVVPATPIPEPGFEGKGGEYIGEAEAGDGEEHAEAKPEYRDTSSRKSRADESRKTFGIQERKDLQKVLGKLELQLSGLADEKQAARVGELLEAQELAIGKLYAKGGDYELFPKLVRVET